MVPRGRAERAFVLSCRGTETRTECGATHTHVGRLGSSRLANGWVLSMRLGWRCPACVARAEEEKLAAKILRRLYPRPRGFSTLPKERRQEIASKGGRAAHAAGTGHEWTPEQAREAGRRGGLASRGGRGKHAAAATA